MTTYGTIPTSNSPIKTNVAYMSRTKKHPRSGLSTRRPWKEMLNHRSFTLPSNILEALDRAITNLDYFLMNYTITMLFILFLGLLWRPISLIVLTLMMVAWLYFYFLRDQPLIIVNYMIDDYVVLILLSLLTVVLLLLTKATTNVLVALLVGAVVVLFHGVFRKTEDLFADEELAGLVSPSS